MIELPYIDWFSPATFMSLFIIVVAIYGTYIVITATLESRKENKKYVEGGERCYISQPVLMTRSMGLWIRGAPKDGGELMFEHACRVCGRIIYTKERKNPNAICFCCMYDGRYS